MANPMTLVEAPARKPRPNTSLQVLPVIDVSTSNYLNYQFVPDPCAFPNPLPQDCWITMGPVAGTTKRFGDAGDELATDNFGAYQGVECWLAGGLDTFSGVAERVLRAGEYRVVDGALAGLLEVSAESGGTAATSMAQAIGLLEQVLAVEVPAQGYIYLSPLAATLAAAERLLVLGLDGSLTTNLGTPIVILTEPMMVENAYASGPTTIWRGPIVSSQAPEPTMNTGRALAERLYSIAIECGVWKVDLAALPSQPPTTLTLNLTPDNGTFTAGDQITIAVEANEDSTVPVTLSYRHDGGVWTTLGVMSETGPLEFEQLWDTTNYPAGDYEFRAASRNVSSDIGTYTLLAYTPPGLLLTTVPANEVVVGNAVTAHVVADADPAGPVQLYTRRNADTPILVGPMTELTPTTFELAADTTGLTPGDIYVLYAETSSPGGVQTRTPMTQVEILPAPPAPDDGVLTGPATVAAGDVATIAVTYQEGNGGEAPVRWVAKNGGTFFEILTPAFTYYTGAWNVSQGTLGPPDDIIVAEGDTLTIQARLSDGRVSNDLVIAVGPPIVADPNMGWTKDELIQFAADHNPPISIPSGWTKQQILDAILLALAHDDDEEP